VLQVLCGAQLIPAQVGVEQSLPVHPLAQLHCALPLPVPQLP
jgi:hypothetical protein